MEAANVSSLGLARTLPPRLLRFFALNPPGKILETPQTRADAAQDPSKKAKGQLNPFMPHKNPKTGRWHPPIYSMRHQADLVKLAKAHDVEDLLPYSVKKTDVKDQKRMEHGLRVKGTGAGQKVKGHEWERTLKGRLQKRREAMLNMPKLVQQWAQVMTCCWIVLEFG